MHCFAPETGHVSGRGPAAIVKGYLALPKTPSFQGHHMALDIALL